MNMNMNIASLRKVLKKLVITEKSQNDALKYVFEVEKSATKPVIKQAVEAIFAVQVASVRTLISHDVIRHPGQKHTSAALKKKAYVTVLAGQEIRLDTLTL
jgi:large subunit ribosomal protein L23